MNVATRAEVARLVGCDVADARSVSGGSINDAFSCTLADGRAVFVKTNRGADPRMFPCEAAGLQWLAEADAIATPRVLAVTEVDVEQPVLVLELIEPAPRAVNFDAALGRGLAELHLAGAPGFGLDYDNFLATLEQDNRGCDDWATFYAERRLLPQVALAVDAGHAPARWRRQFDQLAARMAERCGPPEPPARLHGDLWSGNVHTGGAGEPVVIDPAVYGGHREVDLAMLRLFGAPSPRAFSAYDEIYPRAAGHEDRVPLYQLYPLLCHVNLFGGSYVASVEAALSRCS